jgi:FHA domain-containing protein
MTERSEAARRPARAPLPRRSRKRWVTAAGAAVGWLVLLDVTGSVIGASLLLVVLAGLGVVIVLLLRSLGITRDHPWVQQLASRPWRDGQDVLQLALKHLPEVFVVTPSGALFAPNLVELRLNPDDVRSLSERIDLGLVASSAAEVYADQVAAHGARFAGPGPADVRVIADPSVPAGRYQLRQGRPVDGSPRPGFQFAHAGPEPGYPGLQSAYPGPQPAYAGPQPGYAGPPPAHAGHEPVPDGPHRDFVGHDGSTQAQPGQDRVAVVGMPTVREQSRTAIPVLRLVTGDAVAETRRSGARAGRGPVELELPDVPTVSREHARFTFSGGQWWIANLGMNGLTLNGTPLAGEQPLSNGDSIRWGTRPDALLSRVQVG